MGRILIIDDEAPFRRVISDTLCKKGHHVYEAANTADGQRLAIELQPDLIVSDVCMEGGDGLTLLKSIRADSRTSPIPFLVMTGHPDFEGMLTGAEFAADGYLPKPFKLETLISTVENRLDREKVLRSSAAEVKDQLQRILEASPDLIGIIDPETNRFIFLNPAGRKLLGIDPKTEVNDFGIDDLHSARGADLVKTKAIPDALSNGIWAGENCLRSRAGMNIPVKQFVQAHRDPRGAVSFLSTIAHDLTESKEAEAALRSSEARFRSLVDSLPDAVLVHDRDGNILFSNARTEQLFGYAPPEIAGRTVQSIFRESISSSGGAAEPRSQFETRCWRKTGEEIPVGLVASDIEVNGERARLNIIRDLSEQKKLERERQHMEIQLRQALKLESIGQLAAGIAHEINTPTQYIGDNTRFLQDAFSSLAKLLPEYEQLLGAAREGQLTPELIARAEAARKEADLDWLTAEIPLAIQQSLEGVDRVTRIVRAMKDFSHPGVTEKTLGDLNHLIESTVTVARNEWKYVADLQMDLDPALPPVPCLPGEFNQVILNILINASHAISDVVGDASEGKGKILVSTRGKGTFAEIRISDSGGGIPEAIRSRIFEPFFTTKEVGKGTGQGLAISRSVIVDKHGGTIDFETEPGKGTTFILRLPFSQHP